MFNTSKWPQVDSSDVEISPEDASPSDFFDGNPFGDDHIDISNASLDGNEQAHSVDIIGEGTFISNNDYICTFISNNEERNSSKDNDSSNPLDSNELITFSPSTSMNDLTKLLHASPVSRKGKTKPVSIQRNKQSISGPTLKRPVEVDTLLKSSESNKRKKLNRKQDCDVMLGQKNEKCNSTARNTDESKEVPTSTMIKTKDFEDVAQAAVSKLVNTAGNKTQKYTRYKSGTTQDLNSVNTSSAHVTALISHNRIGSSATSFNQVLSVSPANLAQQHGSIAEERAQQNRNRNRAHARNTRLRKKAYIEDLKRTLAKLVVERDARELKLDQEKQEDIEVREVRYRVMEEFLKLRAKWSDMDLLDRWVDILEDGFTLTLPKTNYRKMVQNHSNTASPQTQVLRGAAQCLEDASNVDLFINTLVNNINPDPNNKAVSMTYVCDRKNSMMDGVDVVLPWTGSTSGAIKQGAMVELHVKGCMKAKFNPSSNKLLSAELHFDTGVVSAYLNAFYTHQANENMHGRALRNDYISKSDGRPSYATPLPISERNGLSSNATIISYEKSDYDAPFSYVL